MLHDPVKSYELAQAHQEELWYDAQLDRWAKDASARGPHWTERLLVRSFSRLSAIAFSRRARSQATPASSCQESMANRLYHPRLPSLGASQSHAAMPTAHGVPHPHGVHGHAG